MLLVVDRTTRKRVAAGDFLGLDRLPSQPAEKTALIQLAADPKFITVANNMCLGDPTDAALSEGPWTRGSASVLRDQDYGTEGTIPFQHFRFVKNIQP